MAKKRAVYSLTDEHRARLPEWRDLWLSRILRTAPQTDEDRRFCTEAIDGLYRAAKLPTVPVIYVPSPIVGAAAWCFASMVWWLREHPEKHVALCGRTLTETDYAAAIRVASARIAKAAHGLPLDPLPKPSDATNVATSVATNVATRVATSAATNVATSAATNVATSVATRDATSVATRDATRDATHDATRVATRVATSAATNVATRAATHAATHDATRDATNAATHDATRDATNVATNVATHDATRAATHAATHDATRDATNAAATHDATHAATHAATRDATNDATNDATDGPLVRLLLASLAQWSRNWNGGNHWGQWCSYLSFFREVAGLRLPEYDRWIHYERAAIYGCHRFMHSRFCLVSDFPKTISRDVDHRSHAEHGPALSYRDGWSVYSWHGTRVPREWIERRGSLDPTTALTWPQIEQRRAAAEIVGWDGILAALPHETIDTDPDPEIGTLLRVDLPDSPGERFLRVRCGTGRMFVMPVPPEVPTALAAQEWIWSVGPGEYRPEVRT